MALHDPPIDLPFVDLKTGYVTEPWQQWLLINKRDKANRVENGTEDNVATLDANGHPQDSSIVLAGIALVGTTDTQELSNKTFAELVSTKILASNGSKGLSEIDLVDWIAGTESQIVVTDGGDGTVTLSIPLSIYIEANAITLNNGTTGSTISDLQTLLDGNTYDISEVSGVPGIDLEIDFVSVTQINSIVCSAYYVGSATHAVRIQLYNYNTVSYDTIHTLNNGVDFEQHFKTIVDDTNYIDGSGNAKMRLYHTESGNASHDLYIDYVALKS